MGDTMATMREQLDAYVKDKYRIDPEVLPFAHEDYEIYRHQDTGKWFAVFIVKDRQKLGLPGAGSAEIVCFKLRDVMLGDFISQQPGYLRGYSASNWNWISAVLDGTVQFTDICHWINESFKATDSKSKNKRTPLAKKDRIH